MVITDRVHEGQKLISFGFSIQTELRGWCHWSGAIICIGNQYGFLFHQMTTKPEKQAYLIL